MLGGNFSIHPDLADKIILSSEKDKSNDSGKDEK
jgi:hypothetical protein